MNTTLRAFFLSTIIFSGRALAQPPEAPRQLLTTLRAQVFEGNATALRDLGSLIGRGGFGGQPGNFLHEASFIADPAWPQARRDRQDFLNFFYKNRERLFYDDLLDAWLTQPIENQEVKAETQPLAGRDHPAFLLKKWGGELTSALEKGDSAAIAASLENLVLLENSADFLLSTAKKLDGRQPQHVFAWLANALVAVPTDEKVDLILDWARQKLIDGDHAEYAIETALNHYIGTNVPEVEAERVRFWRDSLGTLDNIRQHGFESQVNTLPIFFENEVDYWGRVLSLSGNLPWVAANARAALARTHHPRAIYYLASQVAKLRERSRFRSFPGTRQGVLRQIEHLTGQKTGVADSLGRVQFGTGDRVWAFNYAAFWAKNHEKYEWDTRRQCFVDREAAGSLEEETDRLFRRLGSASGAAALEAYQKLTEADPATVIEKAEQYRQLVRNFNPLLPSFKYRFLEALVQLTDFCSEDGHDWRPSPRLDPLLKKLDDAPPPERRYLIENEAIASLALTDATALEYAACLRERDLEFNFSASRILDRLYTRHWAELTGDPSQLRLFLKKAALFGQIGTVGACNFYLQKTGWRAPQPERRTIDGKLESAATQSANLIDKAFLKAVADLEKEEPDEDILQKIAQLLTAGGRPRPADAATWMRFYEDPNSLKTNELAQLPPLDKKGRKKFAIRFRAEKDPARAVRYLDLLEQRPDIGWAPHLLDMLDDPRRDSSLDVRKRALSMLEKTVQIELRSGTDEDKARQWKSFQKNWGSNYADWRERSFEEKLRRLSTADSLSIADVNDVAQSPFFREEHKKAALSALQKVRPAASAKRFAPLDKLRVPGDLAFFEPIPLGYRDLDDLSRLFAIDRPDTMLGFFLKKAEGFDVGETGIFLNEIMRQQWLRTYLNALPAATPTTERAETALRAHLESTELSEFEEGATALHLLFLENIGMTFQQKLLATFKLDLDARAKGQLQHEILAGTPWAQVAEVAPLFEQLSPGEDGRPAWHFLTTDFGLPPGNYAQNPDNQEFIKILKENTQAEATRFYLKKFGINVPDLASAGPPDFEKIAEWLAFDVVTPFVGGGGERRDWYVFGLIKLLEDRFGTRLGFHEKLNEDQTFYTYNASKRAAAWLRFLREKGLTAEKPAGGLPFVR